VLGHYRTPGELGTHDSIAAAVAVLGDRGRGEEEKSDERGEKMSDHRREKVGSGVGEREGLRTADRRPRRITDKATGRATRRCRLPPARNRRGRLGDPLPGCSTDANMQNGWRNFIPDPTGCQKRDVAVTSGLFVRGAHTALRSGAQAIDPSV
jgi:hypothetical protein